MSSYSLELGHLHITHFRQFFAEAEPGEIFAMPGSSGMLEIAMNRGSALLATGIVSGVQVR